MVNKTPREKKLAQRIIKKYNLSPPVDIRNLIENYAKCVEDALPNNADAICIMNIETPLVILDRFKSPNRKRFTLAHELGHLIIPWHNGMISCHTDKDENLDGDSYQIMEAEANSFAAEILMPSEWLTRIVEEFKESGLTEILQIVSHRAEVSMSAAFFSVIHHLQPGYIFYIKNDEWFYGSLRRSKGTDIAIPSSSNEYDGDWLDSCAIAKDSISLDSITVTWWKIPQSLSETELVEIIEESTDLNLNYIFNRINSYGPGVFAASFSKLVNLLPPGYLISVSGDDYKRPFKSPDTNIAPPYYDNVKDEIHWFKEHSYKSGHNRYLGYNYVWGYFVVSAPSPNSIKDNRLSKDILRKILKDCYSTEPERLKFTHKINGIVGSLNNKAPDEFSEFYRIFKEKFIGVEIYIKITEHPEFEIFVINKIKELLAKKARQ